MARDVLDDKVADSNVNLSGIGLSPSRQNGDVSGARFFYNKDTGTYEWGFPVYDQNGQLVSWDPVVNRHTDSGARSMADYWLNNPVTVRNNPVPPPSGGDGSGGSGGIPGIVRRAAPLAAGAIAGRTAFGGGGGTGASAQIPPELTELLRMSLQRVRDQEPLFQSITAQARGGLPTAYQRNGGGQ